MGSMVLLLRLMLMSNNWQHELLLNTMQDILLAADSGAQ